MRNVLPIVGIVLVSSLVGACKPRVDPPTATAGTSASNARDRRVADLLARLDVALQKGAPRVLDRFHPGASEEQLADFEKYFGMRLPDTLRALYRWHDGMNPVVDGVYAPAHLYAGHWMSSLQQVRTMHKLRTAMSKDGTYQNTGRGGAGWWDSRWIPVFENDFGGSLCVDMAGSFTGVPGQLLQEWHDDASRTVEYRSLDNWLDTFVLALEMGILKATLDSPTSIEASEHFGEEGSEQKLWLLYQQVFNLGYPQTFRAVGGH